MCVHSNSFMTSHVEKQPPPKNCCKKGAAQGNVAGARLGPQDRKGCRKPSRAVESHLVLLMGAEVQQDVQVLELAGRALEDQVSEGGHAQVGATLARGRDQAQAACREPRGGSAALLRSGPALTHPFHEVSAGCP